MEGADPLDDDELHRGRDAYVRREWAGAFTSLTRADEAASLSVPDLQILAWSAYLIARHDDFVRAMERAHHAQVDDRDCLGAARSAVWLGFVFGSRGEIGQATGWFARADRLVERDGRDCVERGYLMLPVLFGHALSSAWEELQVVAAQAAAIGDRFGEADLTSFALHWQGRALLRQGKTTEGQKLLDEAMVAVSAGEVSPMFTGIIYCSVIEAFQEVFALRRSQEWTSALSRWCDGQPDLVPFSGQCLVHRSELMMLHGSWEEALEEARRAATRSAAVPDQFVRAAALCREGDVHRRRGDLSEAAVAYRDASELGGDPQPGLALLSLAAGDTGAARAAITRRLDETLGDLERARLLPALIEISLAAGDPGGATEACAELDATGTRYGSPVLKVTATAGAGAVALAKGDATAAVRLMRDTCRAWQELDAPYELARARELLGLACRSLGDDTTATLELDAARVAYERLGAQPDLGRVERLAQPPAVASRFTDREHEVLRLVATGQTNKEIGAALHVSERTVDRHVSNILAKIGVPSRAAATAYAYENHLV